MAHLESRHLKSFIILASCRHFGKAAEQLNTTQPQLSRLLQHIEEEVGFSLVVRTTRSFDLTPAGHKFLEMAQKSLQSLEDAVQHTRRVGSGENGAIRIGYNDFAINHSLPMLLKSFRAISRGIKVQLEHLCTEGQRLEILHSNLDVGFLIGPFLHPNIDTLPVNSKRLMACLPDIHALGRKSGIRLVELADEDFIMGKMCDWRPYRELVERVCVRAGFVPNVVHEPYNSDGIFGLVAGELGITIYPERPPKLIPRGALMKPLIDVTEEVELVAAWRRDNPSPILSKFLETVRARVPKLQPRAWNAPS